jgi:uncharacterized protein (TIGR04255 family)
MSKLPKAPLVEVVLELRWSIISKPDLAKIQYLYGDMYAELKNKYPFRESVVPTEIPLDILINQPVHRFRHAINDYPLFQVGPGIITLNTTDKKYFWDTFSKDADELFSVFFKVFPFTSTERITPSILFLDFFPFDFSKSDVYEYLNKNFNITFNQSFIQTEKYPRDLNIGYFYEIPSGELSITFQKGKNENQQDGIIMQTRINGKPILPDKKDISAWVEIAHETCSDLFKKLTQGELYESFK